MVRQSVRGLVFAAVVLSASSLFAESLVVRCESKGGRRICPAENIGSVVIKRQRSMSSCTEGTSWGYTRDAIWVDDGCRADFQVFTRRYDRDRDGDANRGRDWADLNRGLGTRLICESRGSREFCAADTRSGVRIARTLGTSDCIEGRSWGFNDRGVWVDRGCRAEFVIGTDRDRYDRDRDRSRYDRYNGRVGVVTCESSHDRRNHCAVDTQFGVELKKQLSISDCTFGKTWGYDRYGIWVTNGCRAEFSVRGR